VINEEPSRPWDERPTLKGQEQEVSRPSPDKMHFDRGYDSELHGRWETAENEYRIAISYNPGEWDYYRHLGYVLHMQHKYTEALQSYRRALALIPPQGWVVYISEIHTSIGWLFRDQGRYEEAENEYLISLRLNKNSSAKRPLRSMVSDQRLNIIENRFKKATSEMSYKELNPESAERKLRKIELVFPTRSVYNNLGVALARQGKPLAAEAAYKRALRLDPDDKLVKDNLKEIKESMEHNNAFKELKAMHGTFSLMSKETLSESLKGSAMACWHDTGNCTYDESPPIRNAVFRASERNRSNLSIPPELKKDPEIMRLSEEKQKLDRDRERTFKILNALQDKQEEQHLFGRQKVFSVKEGLDEPRQFDKNVELLVVEYKGRLSQIDNLRNYNEFKKREYVMDKVKQLNLPNPSELTGEGVR
jgi:tetratricopeptide (TPR) repeat protein